MNEETILQFKNREVKAKDVFVIKPITKNTAYEFVKKYHYLGDAKFFCVEAYGLFSKEDDELIGCATYSLPQGNVALKGWFSLDNDTKDIYELSRLCMLPSLNGTNATSFLLGGSLKQLKKKGFCRAVITLACSERHVGSIYQVCNFKYYGLTAPKSDFFRIDGKVNPRGRVSEWQGVWLPRARKHRYAYIFDSKLKCNYPEQPRPTVDQTMALDCCNGTYKVYDARFGKWYTCPKCTGELKEIKFEEKEE